MYLAPFDCTDIFRSSFVRRICYHRVHSYMLINLDGTYYHYCAIDGETAARPSIGGGPSIQRPLSEHSGHGRTLSSLAPVAIDPFETSAEAELARVGVTVLSLRGADGDRFGGAVLVMPVMMCRYRWRRPRRCAVRLAGRVAC